MFRKKVMRLSCAAALMVYAALPIPCFAKDAEELLAEVTLESGRIVSADNGLFFYERNPNALTIRTMEGLPFTGIYRDETLDYLYCCKDSVTVKFDGAASGLLYTDENGYQRSNDPGITIAMDTFLNRYDNNTGYGEIVYQSNDIRYINAFEELLSNRIGNAILKAGQENIIRVQKMDDSNFAIYMGQKEDVERFKTELSATNAFTEELNQRISGITDVYGKIRCINDFICEKIHYNDATKWTWKYNDYAYTEVDAITNDTGTTCSGYTNLFSILCKHYGIPCENVYMDGMDHTWSANDIDGQWYYTDVTWNDTTGEDRYLLLSYDEMAQVHQFPANWAGN